MKDQILRLQAAHQCVKRHITLFFILTADQPLITIDLLNLANISITMIHPILQLFLKIFIFLRAAEIKIIIKLQLACFFHALYFNTAHRITQERKKLREFFEERERGIEPPASAWEAEVLPLYDPRIRTKLS